MPKKLVAGVAALFLLLAACGGDDDDSASNSSDTAATETTAAATETTAAATGAAAVDVATTSLGDVLVDAQGFTLYVFDNDTPGTSSCTGPCLDHWPPAIVDSGFTVGGSLDQSMFTTIQSPSGTQLAVNQRPLYTYASDPAPGDVTGQAVGGVWWAVGPDGNAIGG